MKIALKLAVVALLLLAFLFVIPSAAFLGFAEDSGEIIEIPLDTAELRRMKDPFAVPAPLESGYISDTEYEDPSISVSITTGRWINTDYMVARVKIANATQIRSAFGGSYSNPEQYFGERFVEKTNAVLAINGDFFAKRNPGLMIRQGKTFSMPKSDRNLSYNGSIQYDILLIDDQGDLHIMKECRMDDLRAFEGTVINTFTFGPGLVIDGVKQENFPNTNNGVTNKTQRMAIAQVGPLEYLCVCCEGPDDPGSEGLLMEEFADLVASLDVVNAYNLDGGTSSTMLFRGTKVNCPKRRVRRELVDILYFASAYVPSPAPEETGSPVSTDTP